MDTPYPPGKASIDSVSVEFISVFAIFQDVGGWIFSLASMPGFGLE
jgi:hypothetical protein